MGTRKIDRPPYIDIDEHCGNGLIHSAHNWDSYEQVIDEDDQTTDAWRPVDAWCEGNDDQDDPFFRFECCAHCASKNCPRRDGHSSACKTCRPGQTMLGESEPNRRSTYEH